MKRRIIRNVPEKILIFTITRYEFRSTMRRRRNVTPLPPTFATKQMSVLIRDQTQTFHNHLTEWIWPALLLLVTTEQSSFLLYYHKCAAVFPFRPVWSNICTRYVGTKNIQSGAFGASKQVCLWKNCWWHDAREGKSPWKKTWSSLKKYKLELCSQALDLIIFKRTHC